jgi:hypothetical protein
MNNILQKYPRILAISPTSRGFGYALIEGHKSLALWGMKWIEGNKNASCIKKAEKMIDRYNPQVFVLEDTAAKGSLRSRRIQALTKRLVAGAEKRTVKWCCSPKSKYGGSFWVMIWGRNTPSPKSSRRSFRRNLVSVCRQNAGPG